MHASHSRPARHAALHTPRALALLLAAGLAAPALAQDVHWSAASGIWDTPANWTPFGTPLPFENVFIGSHANAENATVWLDTVGPRHMGHLTITDGMTLRNNMGSFAVAGNTTLSGSNTVPGPFGVLTTYASRLLLEPMKGSSLTTHNLTLSNGARIDLTGQAFAGVNGVLNIGTDSRIGGVGFFNMNGAGTTLINNGRLRGLDGAGLAFRQNNGGLFDLDGTTGNGIIDVGAGYESYLRIIGTALTDSFSSDIIISRSSRLDMDLTEGWTADANSTITVLNDHFGDFPATIRGGAMTVAGDMELGSSLSIYADALTIEPSARVHIEDGYYLGAGASGVTHTTINGGVFTMDPTSNIAFHNQATMRGGEFNMEPNEFGAYGRFRIYDHSIWDGNVTINGLAEMFDHATVAGPTVIDADMFDLSPTSFTPTVWDINNSLVLNANALSQISGNRVLATLNVAGGVFAQLTLNLSDPDAAWTMEGEMNLSGIGILPVTRVGGSRMIVQGGLNVSGGLVQVTADTDFDGAAVDIADGSTLRMRGRTLIDNASAFLSEGTLRNGLGGVMELQNGAALSATGLINDAYLAIEAGGLGVASVARYVSTPDSVFAIEIGSDLAVAGNDVLLVGNGGATLDGRIEVAFTAFEALSLMPEVGDEYIILIALDGVTGAFINDPVTIAGSLTYQWDVIYNPNTVVLRLESIVPAPGTLALLSISGLIAARRRRV